MGKVIPIRARKKRSKIEEPSVPMCLGRTRVAMLYRLFARGYVFTSEESDIRALRELRKYGYARRDTSSPGVWHITPAGEDRLIAPMRLVKEGKS